MKNLYLKRKKPRTTTQVADRLPTPRPQDRLSSLPDDVLVDVLSLLPTRTSVSTSVLSIRWRFLWMQANSLELDCRHFPQQTSDFYFVVDHILTRLTSPTLRAFSLRVPCPRSQHFEPWLRHVCALNPNKIDITSDSFGFDNNSRKPFTLPHCIFQTKSLVCFKLNSYSLDYIMPNHDTDFNINLPNLKILELQLRPSHYDLVTKLLRSCLLIEDMFLSFVKCWTSKTENGTLFDISSENMKRLNLSFFAPVGNEKVVIDAPKLDTFGLYAPCLISCSFVKKPVALREARITTSSETLMLSLLPAILNVRVLQIRLWTFGFLQGFKDDQGKSLIFRNLTELEFLLTSGRVDDDLDGLTYFPSPSLLLHVKKIEVTTFSIKDGREFKKWTDYLLSNAPALDTLTFHVLSDSRRSDNKSKFILEEMLFCIEIYSYSSNSPQCLIKFNGQHAKVPINITELHELENQVKALRENIGCS